MLHVSTYVLPEMFIAVPLVSFIHRFPIIQNFQLRIYNDVHEEITILKIVTNFLHACS